MKNAPILPDTIITSSATPVYGSPFWWLGRLVIGPMLDDFRFLARKKQFTSDHAFCPDLKSEHYYTHAIGIVLKNGVKAHRLVVAHGDNRAMPESFMVEGDPTVYSTRRLYVGSGYQRVPVWVCFDAKDQLEQARVEALVSQSELDNRWRIRKDRRESAEWRKQNPWRALKEDDQDAG